MNPEMGGINKWQSGLEIKVQGRMVVFQQDPVAVCQQGQGEAPQQDRMGGCPLGQGAVCRLALEAAFLPAPEVVYPKDQEAVCRQDQEAAYQLDPVEDYQLDRAAACQRDQRHSTAIFHLGQFSYENLGNVVLTNTQT